MPTGPAAEVQPTFEDQFTGPLGGALLSTVLPDNSAGRWENGFAYRSRGVCRDATRWAPCLNQPYPDPAGYNVPIVDVTAFEVVVPFRCNSQGLTEDERKAIAETSLAWYEGTEIEAELWAGDMASATYGGMEAGSIDPVLSPFLANAATMDNLSYDSGTSTTTSSPLMFALASLQGAIRGSLGSARPGIIHATTSTISLWQQGGALKNDPDGHIRDLFGNYFVAGAGYDGSGPVTVAADGTRTGGDLDTTGKTAWAYATGGVGVRLGEVGVRPDNVAQAMTRETNDVTFYGFRTAAAWFTPCHHFGIRVDLCNTGCS